MQTTNKKRAGIRTLRGWAIGVLQEAGAGRSDLQPSDRSSRRRRHGLHFTGIDGSRTLVSICQGMMPDQEWMVGDMRSLALGRTFDGVLAWDSFFHLTHDDQLRMFPIFAAHCAPGGNLMFNAGFSQGEAVGSYRGDPLRT